MLLYQSTISALGYEEQYGSVVSRHQLTCGSLIVPVADLQSSDFEENSDNQTCFTKNLRAVTIADKDTDCVMQVYRNDRSEPARATFAISYRFKPGYVLKGIDQRFVANKFWIGKEGIDIIGREFPEVYTMSQYLFRLYGADEETGKSFIEVRFSISEDGTSIVCTEIEHPAESQYARCVLCKKSFTSFVRVFGVDKFVNGVRVPPKTRIFVSPDMLKKVGVEKALNRYFPGGYSEDNECHAESWEYNPDNLINVIDAILQDKEHPVYQVYFIGYPFNKTKVLREIVDEGFANRSKKKKKPGRASKDNNSD